MVDLVKNWGSSMKGHPQTSKKVWGIDYLMQSLESCDVGLTFQLKMFEFMDYMNQELQVGKEMTA